MELDSVLIKVYSESDLRRLRRAGGEVWQSCERGGTWQWRLIKLDAATAIRLQLIALAEVQAVAESA